MTMLKISFVKAKEAVPSLVSAAERSSVLSAHAVQVALVKNPHLNGSYNILSLADARTSGVETQSVLNFHHIVPRTGWNQSCRPRTKWPQPPWTDVLGSSEKKRKPHQWKKTRLQSKR